MEKSTHRADVIELKFRKHPNADKLSIVDIDGYTIVTNTEQWNSNIAVHILPDSIVDLSRPEFKFLDDGRGNTHHRVKCKKLRGIVSYGLLMPAPSHLKVGDDAAPYFGITHYDPELTSSSSGQNVKAPVHFSKYDVDAFLKFHRQFIEGEEVVCTEKINGANCRIVYKDGQVYVGSRNFWKVDEPNSLFWKAYRSDPSIEEFVKKNPNAILFGEAYGEVKGFKYGLENGAIKFAAFDIWKDGRWLDYSERLFHWNLPWTPKVYSGPYSFDIVTKTCEGLTLLGDGKHIREGVVIQPINERIDEKWGRVKYKIINPEYLEKH